MDGPSGSAVTPGSSIFITQDLAQQRDVVRSADVRYTPPSAMGYVDLHSHVLFGLDDGAPDRSTSIAMLDALASLGVSEQCATPHQKAGQYLPAWEIVEQTFSELTAERRPAHPTLRLAAENMWDDVFYQRATDDRVPGYRETSAFLVELPPPLLPPGLVDRLFKFRRDGKVPVLAHPERYHALWDDDELARSLRRHCAFVIDLPALGGFHGRREAKAARHLVEAGLAAAVATDAHRVGDVQQALAGLQWIDKQLGPAAVARLFDHAPRAILAGELPD
jgi:protein-tyrosine phosphatase